MVIPPSFAMSAPSTLTASLMEPFEKLANFLGELDQWELVLDRPHWQNYFASLGATAVATCRSIHLLVRADSTEGVAMLTRELFQLATRFVYCIEQKERALFAGLNQEMKQLVAIDTAQKQRRLFSTTARMRECVELKDLLGLPPDFSNEAKEPESGGNIGSLGAVIYKWLCLDAHNRPGAILAKHGSHVETDVLTPFGRVSREQVDQYLRFSAYAVGEMGRRYLRSAELFLGSDREKLMERLETLLLPLALKLEIAPVEEQLRRLAKPQAPAS